MTHTTLHSEMADNATLEQVQEKRAQLLNEMDKITSELGQKKLEMQGKVSSAERDKFIEWRRRAIAAKSIKLQQYRTLGVEARRLSQLPMKAKTDALPDADPRKMMNALRTMLIDLHKETRMPYSEAEEAVLQRTKIYIAEGK